MENFKFILIVVAVIAVLFCAVYVVDQETRVKVQDSLKKYPTCPVFEKGTIGIVTLSYVIKVKCPDGIHSYTVPESQWINYSIGDNFDRVNIR